MQTDFERRTTTFATEVFLIAEWIAVIAAFIIAGKKLNVPLATGFGYALWMIASFYVGVKTDNLVAYARYKNKPREFPKFGFVRTIFVTLVFGLGVGQLIKTMMESLSLAENAPAHLAAEPLKPLKPARPIDDHDVCQHQYGTPCNKMPHSIGPVKAEEQGQSRACSNGVFVNLESGRCVVALDSRVDRTGEMIATGCFATSP